MTDFPRFRTAEEQREIYRRWLGKNPQENIQAGLDYLARHYGATAETPKPRWSAGGAYVFDGEREALHLNHCVDEPWTQADFEHRAKLAQKIADLLNETSGTRSDDEAVNARPTPEPRWHATQTSIRPHMQKLLEEGWEPYAVNDGKYFLRKFS